MVRLEHRIAKRDAYVHHLDSLADPTSPPLRPGRLPENCSMVFVQDATPVAILQLYWRFGGSLARHPRRRPSLRGLAPLEFEFQIRIQSRRFEKEL